MSAGARKGQRIPTIDEALRRGLAKSLLILPELQQRVLEYLETHSNEVFGYEDAHELAAKIGGVGWEEVQWALRLLDGKGLLAKARLGRKTYFGSRLAITHLLLASRALVHQDAPL